MTENSDSATEPYWRGLFLVYGDHKEDCPRRAMWDRSWPPPDCVCGFSAAVAWFTQPRTVMTTGGDAITNRP